MPDLQALLSLSDGELNRMAALAMGWHDAISDKVDRLNDLPYPLFFVDGEGVKFFRECPNTDTPFLALMSAEEWSPATSLDQADEFATKMGYGYSVFKRTVWIVSKGQPRFEHDGTTPSKARALTAATLHAAALAGAGGEEG